MNPCLRDVVAVLVGSALCAASAQSISEATGLDALGERLGGLVPTGLGVTVAMVEAKVGNAYWPDPGDPEFAGKTIQFESPGNGVSGHATNVGRHFFGLATGIAPGPVDVRAYDVGHWTGAGFLSGSGSTSPLDAGPIRIFNHSWVGSLPGANGYLRKVDYVIGTQDVFMAYGVNNGAQAQLGFTLLAQAFNGVAVGRSDGNHAHGTTTLAVDGPGRMKPELVAPAGATSWSTPLVSGAASLLIETAESEPGLIGNPDASRAVLLKAVLMAGARKRAGWSNGAPTSGPLRGSTSTPLDPVFGADQIDVNQSHWILTSLEQAGSSTPDGPNANQRGWEVFTILENQSRFWRFEVSVAKPVVDACLTWNRRVEPAFNGWFSPDLDLRLWQVDEGGALVSLVGETSPRAYAAGNAESASAVDNVELLHLEGLAAGTYALEVSRAIDFTFLVSEAALAWNMQPQAPEVYCTAKTTSNGCVPSIDSQGYPSATDPNPFLIRADSVINQKNGLLFYGYGPASLPFQGGLLCVLPPLRRTAIDSSGGSPPPEDCSGAFEFDMRALIQSGADPVLVPGVEAWAQFWFRDPNDASGSGLSDGLAFAVGQ